MRIATIDAVRIRVPRIHPFELASGTFTAADHVIVRVTLEDGTAGFGESAPMVQFSKESQSSVFAVSTERLAPAIVGLDALNMAMVHRRMDAAPVRQLSSGQLTQPVGSDTGGPEPGITSKPSTLSRVAPASWAPLRSCDACGSVARIAASDSQTVTLRVLALLSSIIQ